MQDQTCINISLYKVSTQRSKYIIRNCVSSAPAVADTLQKLHFKFLMAPSLDQTA